MGRRATGTKKRTATGWFVEVPIQKGSRKRSRHRFATEAEADLWRADALAALNSGKPLPSPSRKGDSAERVPPLDRDADGANGAPVHTSPVAARTPSFDEVAAAWVEEYFVKAARAGVGRKRDAEDIIRNHLSPFMNRRGFRTGSDVTRDSYFEFLLALTRPEAKDRAIESSTEFVTFNRAVELTGASISSIKRRHKAGEFPLAKKDERGRNIVPVSNLVDAGLCGEPLRTGPRAKGSGYSQGFVGDIRRTFENVLRYGRDTAGWALQFELSGVPTPLGDDVEGRREARGQVTVADAAAIAANLHAVHQVSLWLLRLLGLRISEGYGIRVGDVLDDGKRGLLRVYRQGGKTWHVRGHDGEETTTTRVERLKNERSQRVLVIPKQLMELIRVTIDVFHTDPATGEVFNENRLIPGLMVDGVSGQEAFRSALRVAAAKANISVGGAIESALELPIPHDMRKGAITDLAWTDLSERIALRWAGHSPGGDVHNRTYVLDDPSLKPMRKAAKAIERVVKADCPQGILIPTRVRCTTGKQVALAADAARIDAALMDAGWLIATPMVASSGPWCDTAAVATLLEIHPTSAREWMRANADTEILDGGRFIPLATVLSERKSRASLRTLDRLASEIGVDYHSLYQLVRRLHLPCDKVGTSLSIPQVTEDALCEYVAEQDSLSARAMPVADAAAELGLTVGLVDGLIRGGELVVDPVAGPRNARYVTNASVDAYRLANCMPT